MLLTYEKVLFDLINMRRSMKIFNIFYALAMNVFYLALIILFLYKIDSIPIELFQVF